MNISWYRKSFRLMNMANKSPFNNSKWQKTRLAYLQRNILERKYRPLETIFQEFTAAFVIGFILYSRRVDQEAKNIRKFSSFWNMLFPYGDWSKQPSVKFFLPRDKMVLHMIYIIFLLCWKRLICEIFFKGDEEASFKLTSYTFISRYVLSLRSYVKWSKNVKIQNLYILIIMLYWKTNVL